MIFTLFHSNRKSIVGLGFGALFLSGSLSSIDKKMQPVSKLFIWSEGQDRSLMKNALDVVSKTYISRLEQQGTEFFTLFKTVLDCQL